MVGYGGGDDGLPPVAGIVSNFSHPFYVPFILFLVQDLRSVEKLSTKDCRRCWWAVGSVSLKSVSLPFPLFCFVSTDNSSRQRIVDANLPLSHVREYQLPTSNYRYAYTKKKKNIVELRGELCAIR